MCVYLDTSYYNVITNMLLCLRHELARVHDHVINRLRYTGGMRVSNAFPFGATARWNARLYLGVAEFKSSCLATISKCGQFNYPYTM